MFQQHTQVLFETATRPYTMSREDLKHVRTVSMIFENMLDLLIGWICPMGSLDPLYQFHYSEINNELFLLKGMEYQIVERTHGKSNIGAIMTDTKLARFIARYDATLEVMNNTLAYYSENSEVALQLNEHQESMPQRFDLLAKLHALNTYNDNMTLDLHTLDNIMNATVKPNDRMQVNQILNIAELKDRFEEHASGRFGDKVKVLLDILVDAKQFKQIKYNNLTTIMIVAAMTNVSLDDPNMLLATVSKHVFDFLISI